MHDPKWDTSWRKDVVSLGHDGAHLRPCFQGCILKVSCNLFLISSLYVFKASGIVVAEWSGNEKERF